jgi:hypothetical protein
MTVRTTNQGTIHELDLRDIEFYEDRRSPQVLLRDALDESTRTSGPHPAWVDAMDRADTRIWIRPYAARLD